MGRAVALLLLASLALGEDRIEKRDHGKRTGKQSAAVSGHAIAYEATADRPFVRSVLVHGARYGEGYDPARTTFEISLIDEKSGVLATVAPSYGEFAYQIFTWVEVPLPEPVRVPRSYRVVVDFHATETRGVYVGYGDAAKSRSSYFRDGRSQPFGKEWMIRVRTSKSAEPLRAPPRDLREALGAARVPPIEAGDLAAGLARVAEAATVSVVLDGPSRPAPSVEATDAATALDRLGVAWDARWGVVFVAKRERLAGVPAAMPDAEGDGPTPPDAVALRTELARRRVDLDCRDLPLEEAVARIADWLEFRVVWEKGADRRQRVTAAAQGLRAHDALSLLLLPRGLCFGIDGRSIVIAPLPDAATDR